jgi:aryl-alcohol dehydrogenase-like predicted oxidoreductase
MFQGWASRFNEGDVAAICAAASQAGVSFYETSEAYGFEGHATSNSSESLIRRHALTQEPAGRPVVVASKFLAPPTNLNFLFGGGMRMGERSLSEALDRTMQRLGVNTVDVYQIHSPVPASSQQVRPR